MQSCLYIAETVRHRSFCIATLFTLKFIQIIRGGGGERDENNYFQKKKKKKTPQHQIPCLHFGRQENSGNYPNVNLRQIYVLLKQELRV